MVSWNVVTVEYVHLGDNSPALDLVCTKDLLVHHGLHQFELSVVHLGMSGLQDDMFLLAIY